MNKTYDKKKVFIISILTLMITLILNNFMNWILVFIYNNTSGIINQFVMNSFPFAVPLVAFIIEFLFGKKLTKNSRGAVIFLGAISFAIEFTGIFDALLTKLLAYLSYAVVVPNAVTIISTIIIDAVVTISAAVIIAKIFPCLVGFVRSRADENTIKVKILTVLAVVLSTAAYIVTINMYDTFFAENMDIIREEGMLAYELLHWLNVISPFAAICAVGCLNGRKKSRIIAFISCMSLGYSVSNCIREFFNMLLYRYVDSVLIYRFGIIVFLAVSLLLLRFFFPSEKETQMSEAALIE